MIAHLAGEPGARRQRLRDIDILLRQIDARDAAADLTGNEARRPANPAADIEDMVILLRGEFLNGARGGNPAADMKLFDGRKVVWLQIIQIGAARFEPGVDPRNRPEAP